MRNYRFNNKFIVRTPAKALKGFYEQDDLKTFFLKKENLEALYLASKDTYSQFQLFIKDGLSEKNEKKLFISLRKYYSRFHSRPTPFGMFALNSVGTWSEDNFLKLDLKNGRYRHTRLDMSVIFLISKRVQNLKCLKNKLTYKPNTSLYKVENELRYIESKYRNSFRSFQLSAIELDEYLEKILSFSSTGKTLDQIVRVLLDKDIDYEEAESFIEEIIASDILTSNLDLSVTGDDPLSKIIDFTSNFSHLDDEINSIYLTLINIDNKIKALDLKKHNNIQDYTDIENLIRNLKIPFNSKRVFQVDSYNKQSNNIEISKSILSDLKAYFIFINKLTGNKNNQTNLKEFAEIFSEKYGSKQIPLATALDREYGIGYPIFNKSFKDEDLIKDLKIPQNNNQLISIPFDKNSKLVFDLLLDAQRKGENIVDISEIKFDLTENISSNNFQDSTTFNFSLLKDNNQKDLIFLNGIGNYTAVSMLGRYAYGSEEINDIAKEIVKEEEKNNPNKIIAEIAHIPEQLRVGNVLIHPAFRKYEIPFLVNSGVKNENTINISDLTIAVSKNREIILKSKSKKKEVIPKLSNAHAYRNSNSEIYKFLCDMQGQNINRGAGLVSNNHLRLLKNLPRIQWKNIILKRATWLLTISDFDIVLSKNSHKVNNINKLRNLWNIPKRILLVEGDKELLLDLEKENDIDILLSNIKKSKEITLEEFLYENNDSLVKNDLGENYVNQIIASAYYSKEVKTKKQNIKSNLRIKSNVQKKFPPLSEWLYFKIYCKEKMVDNILLNDLLPLIEEANSKNILKKWFFLRYNDTGFHLRIRFLTYSGKDNFIIKKINEILTPYIEAGKINNIQIDTYNREVERYGASSMSTSESMFNISSEMTTNYLNHFFQQQKEDRFRWIFGIVMIDRFLSSFNMDIVDKAKLLGELKNNFNLEFKMNKSLKKDIHNKFKNYEKNITESLELSQENIFKFEQEITETYTKKLYKYANEIMHLHKKNLLEVDINSFLKSHIHLNLNRLFVSYPRFQEMVLYNLLFKYYIMKKSNVKYLNNVNQ